MLRNLVRKTFDVRTGEFRISLYMLSCNFLIIAVSMITKPTINALFHSKLGVERLPFAFLAVAVTAIGSSFFYSRALARFPLDRIIKVTLFSSALILVGFGLVLKFNWFGWLALVAVLRLGRYMYAAATCQ